MALLLPYIITLAWTGRIEEKKQVPLITSGKKVILDRKNGESYMDVEEYLPGVVAKQIPAEYGKEALRAQAVIARTFIYQKMNGQDEVKESELHMEYLEEKQMETMWGSESFVTYFQAVEEAVRSTAGEVIPYDGKLIEPFGILLVFLAVLFYFIAQTAFFPGVTQTAYNTVLIQEPDNYSKQRKRNQIFMLADKRPKRSKFIHLVIYYLAIYHS